MGTLFYIKNNTCNVKLGLPAAAIQDCVEVAVQRQRDMARIIDLSVTIENNMPAHKNMPRPVYLRMDDA